MLASLIIAIVMTAEPVVVRSAQSGPWSAASTWENGKTPGKGSSVLIREGHRVVYDIESSEVVRAVYVSGILHFADDRDTRLEVGLLRIEPGDRMTEEGFDCLAHEMDDDAPNSSTAALEVGTPDKPIPDGRKAIIRLHYIEGMDKESFPAMVACGGRMEFHGSPMPRTWIKLEETAEVGHQLAFLTEEPKGWKKGDHVIFTGTTRHLGYGGTFVDSVRDQPSTEERVITDVKPSSFDSRHQITLDAPLKYDHRAVDEFRGEVANLSRNIIIESAEPQGVRGHVMYHRQSAGSISYAEFRHLGKKGVLGRYSLHFHLVGNSMRGSSVVGASIWDSENRWITIHGTNYLVVRDCVGYRSIGHGFFLEDGTEVFNVFDRNLAVQATLGRPLPKQVLPFDHNDGAGFWWANSMNAFTRNVAAECDQYGYRFEARKTDTFDPRLHVMKPDGLFQTVDIRTLPFLRFEDNEAHCMRRFGLNLGGYKGFARFESKGDDYGDKLEDVKSGDVQGVGPDAAHPFRMKNTKLWNSHWPYHAGSPSVMSHDMKIFDSEYGLWRSNTLRHVYKNLEMRQIRSHTVFHPWGGLPNAFEAYDSNLKPVDDLPPVTIVTKVIRRSPKSVLVYGTAVDNEAIANVIVNGREADPVRADFGEWKIEFELPESNDRMDLTAHSVDRVGNVEKLPHKVGYAAGQLTNVSNDWEEGHK